MARALQEAEIKTRSAREKLTEGTHWRGIDGIDAHIGYRKGRRGGQWIVRWYLGEQRYQQATIAMADDEIATGNLDYKQAMSAARHRVEQSRADAAAKAAGPVLTVRDAVKQYMAMRDAREIARTDRIGKSDAHRLVQHVLNDENMLLADKPVHLLTKADLIAWRASLTGKTATRRRITNDFKAALNAVASDELKPTIKAGLVQPGSEPSEPVARTNQILTDDQVRKLIVAAYAFDEDFGRMIVLLAATGARFSQLMRLRVADVEAKRIMVPHSHKGRARNHVKPPIGVPVGADVIKALQPAMEGRKPSDPLLERWRHVRISATQWKRDRRGPWTDAAELARPFNAITKAVEIDGISSYALRHSSIVRGLREGLPTRLVAALHDTSITMIERHYARWIVDGLEELAARAIVPMIAA